MAGLLALPLIGCAWRSGNTEQYIGPVWYRYTAPPAGKAYVSQVVRFGVAGEAGPTSGIALGMSERITVAPIATPGAKAVTASKAPGWSTPISIASASAEQGWKFSPLYLRIDDMPAPVFYSRTTYGLEGVVGTEANALSIGAARRTLSTPPENAYFVLHFEASRPMDTRAQVWSGAGEGVAPPADLLTEIEK